MIEENNEIYLSWEDFETYAARMVAEIEASGIGYDAIIGIARGGLVPATFLAYRLGIKEFYVMNVQSYQGQKMIDPRFLDLPSNIRADRVLVVDDILDSGTTYRLARQWLNQTPVEFDWAVLVDKGKSNVQAKFVGAVIDNGLWVHYPWN